MFHKFYDEKGKNRNPMASSSPRRLNPTNFNFTKNKIPSKNPLTESLDIKKRGTLDLKGNSRNQSNLA